ncbi:cutinase-domain-containing protein [Microdochium bolleyi]|uniref:Cutinase n=1 Tax=Microdochium bolleyi TaxID=196109 RepID=A0A136IRU3_9PEZI|nr:cutinase-domain-containing protein [Microdochium bolleyi]
MKLSTIFFATSVSAAPLLSLNLGLVSLNIGGGAKDGKPTGLIGVNLGNSGNNNNNNNPSDPSLTRNDLVNGNPAECPRVIFVYARGSNEDGNMGSLGPLVAARLESRYRTQGGIWVQGVSAPRYAATLLDNALPSGTTGAAVAEMARLFQLADSRCPGAQIVAGGYSQGAALAAAAVSRGLAGAPSSVRIRGKIAGVVLFGYTKNRQNKGRIPGGFPAERTLVFCAEGDLVCEGTLVVTEAHFGYKPVAAGAAPDFLISRIG